MGFFDKQGKGEGGFVFLSHSHADIEKVRLIRNELEKEGFEPLCFYLKCLDDDSEIEDLIKREIDSREWFLYADSENARKSKWVRLEREYIESTNRKKIMTVDINDEHSVADIVHKISHNLRIFISCSYADFELGKRVKDKLEEKDYLTYMASDDISAGTPYLETVANKLVEASNEGGLVVILTPRSVESEWVKNEVALAFREGGNIIPVLVGDTELTTEFKFYLSRHQLYHLPENPTDAEIEQMVECISRNIVRK